MKYLTSDHLHSLDLETKSLDRANTQFALEPFRVPQGTATVTDISVTGTDGMSVLTQNVNDLPGIIDSLAGKVVYAHNAIFDTTWCLAHDISLDSMRRITWRDTSLIAKWIKNSQKMEFSKKRFSLADCVDHFLMDIPGAAEFIEMKKQGHDIVAGENSEYWTQRAMADTEWTLMLAQYCELNIPKSSVRGYLIEQKCILPIAYSWLLGLKLNGPLAAKTKIRVEEAKRKISRHMGVAESVISSPSQLSQFLFKDNGLTPLNIGKSGKGSTAKDDLLIIQNRLIEAGDDGKAKLLKNVLDFRQLITLTNKYLNGIERVVGYTGDGLSHGSPRIFSTYTGRMTYSSQTLRKKAWQVGLAQHQVPRKGPTKTMICAPDGYLLSEFDASGQESRGMAIMSGDENMLNVFRDGLDFHGITGSDIAGRDYDEFVDAFYADEPEAVNQRYNGKFVNLSCNYRIGDKALQKKAFTQYGISVNFMVARSWNERFKSLFPGVPEYWKSVCMKAQDDGYAETLAGRRFYLSDWNSHRWGTESSAINMPIQGFGAEMKYLAISEVFDKVPEALYALDVHDANFYYTPAEQDDMHFAIYEVLQNLNYAEAWDVDIPIPLPWDAKRGSTWAGLKPLEKRG